MYSLYIPFNKSKGERENNLRMKEKIITKRRKKNGKSKKC